MPGLSYVEAVDQDLLRIERWSQQDADDLRAFFQELEESEDLIDRLATRHYRHAHASPQFDCTPVESLQQRGYNIYRLKVLNLEWSRRFYRVIYAYDVEYDDFIVLAVVLRLTDLTPEHLREHCYNYEPNHPITRRVCDEYERLELPVRH